MSESWIPAQDVGMSEGVLQVNNGNIDSTFPKNVSWTLSESKTGASGVRLVDRLLQAHGGLRHRQPSSMGRDHRHQPRHTAIVAAQQAGGERSLEGYK